MHGHVATAEAQPGSALARLLAADGTAAHPHAARLAAPRAATRDLSDAVHALCAVHGQHPGLFAIAAGGTDGVARDWLLAAADAFAVERAGLAQLTAAAGPLPSTPGQAETAAALATERHALDMLARSERGGVALGAGVALAADWIAVRGVLERAGERFGVTLPSIALPALAETLAGVPERAAAFGAQQLLAQHRGLWSLLDARASARDAQ
jgi:hypothetical protein